MKNQGFFAGLLCGALLFGGTTAYAAGVIAERSAQPICKQVSMTAYSIDGNNYVKLREVGKAVGFNVYLDNAVRIDSDAAYTGEAPAQTADTVSIPQSDAKLARKEGNIVRDDGKTYAVTDMMSRYDKTPSSSSATSQTQKPDTASSRSAAHWCRSSTSSRHAAL